MNKGKIMKKVLVPILITLSSAVYASDPSTSVYEQTKKNSKLFNSALEEGSDLNQGSWKFFQFGDTDSIFGSLSVGQSGDSQSIKFNAINYNLWFGGKKKLPFQLYLSTNASDSSDDSNNDESTDTLLDPEAGLALKFPFLWSYQSSGDGFCAFLSSVNSIGHCSVGGDITLSLKDLEDQDGNTETAFGQTIRIGGAVLFPVLSVEDGTEQGYLSTSVKLVYSHTDIDDPNSLFTPVFDINGNPVDFKDSIFSGEVEVKWAFTDKLAISAKWLTPFDNKDYFDELFRLSLETQF
jgi:hypothetical protein